MGSHNILQKSKPFLISLIKSVWYKFIKDSQCIWIGISHIPHSTLQVNKCKYYSWYRDLRSHYESYNNTPFLVITKSNKCFQILSINRILSDSQDYLFY